MQRPGEPRLGRPGRGAPRRRWLGARRRTPRRGVGNLAPQFPLNGSPQRRIVSALEGTRDSSRAAPTHSTTSDRAPPRCAATGCPKKPEP